MNPKQQPVFQHSRQPKAGYLYFFEGFTLITTKGLRRFVFVPLFVNLVLFISAFIALYSEMGPAIQYVIDLIPEFLGWLKTVLAFILWPLAIMSVLLVFALVFGTIANLIAAPFNGLLAEKVEQHLTGQNMDNTGLLDVVTDIPRTVGRELRKLIYYIPRAVLFLVLFFILPIFGQIIWFMFNAWMNALQYIDYPYDNKKIGFSLMKSELYNRKGLSVSFGAMVNVGAFIPIVNFIVIPVSICGATALWVDHLKSRHD